MIKYFRPYILKKKPHVNAIKDQSFDHAGEANYFSFIRKKVFSSLN